MRATVTGGKKRAQPTEIGHAESGTLSGRRAHNAQCGEVFSFLLTLRAKKYRSFALALIRKYQAGLRPACAGHLSIMAIVLGQVRSSLISASSLSLFPVLKISPNFVFEHAITPLRFNRSKAQTRPLLARPSSSKLTNRIHLVFVISRDLSHHGYTKENLFVC